MHFGCMSENRFGLRPCVSVRAQERVSNCEHVRDLRVQASGSVWVCVLQFAFLNGGCLGEGVVTKDANIWRKLRGSPGSGWGFQMPSKVP